MNLLLDLQGEEFTVIGPFMVLDLGEKKFNSIPVGEHGMEQLKAGDKTTPHTHPFISFYKSEGLAIESEGQRFELPHRALTLVPPGVQHNWVPSVVFGAVGSTDLRHEKQVVCSD